MLIQLGFRSEGEDAKDDLDDISIVEVIEPLWRSDFVSVNSKLKEVCLPLTRYR